MTNTSFKIKTRKAQYYFKVVVYPTTKELIKAAEEHSELSGDAQKNYEGSAGVCHTYERVRISSNGSEKMLNEVGTIRLALTHLSTDIVAHETLHAAMHLYRLLYGSDREYEGSRGNADFGNGCNPDEEELCYLYGQLFRSINGKLHDHNLWN